MSNFIAPFAQDMELMFFAMIEKIGTENQDAKIQEIALLFSVNYESIEYIHTQYINGIVNYKTSSILFNNYQTYLKKTGDCFSFAEFVCDYSLYLEQYKLTDPTAVNTTNIVSSTSQKEFIEPFAHHMQLMFFSMIEKIEKGNFSKIQEVATIFSVGFDRVAYIHKQYINGLINHKISSLIYDDYKSILKKTGQSMSIEGFISDYHLYLNRYLPVIQGAILGANREILNILSGIGFEKIKSIRKKMDIKITVNPSRQTANDAHEIFLFIEENSLEYSAYINETSSKEDLLKVLIRISQDLQSQGILYSPFSQLWKTLLYHYDNGSMINLSTKKKFFSSLLIERIEIEFEQRGKVIEQKRLLSAT